MSGGIYGYGKEELGNGHMYPAFQKMFVNLAPNSQRGTANSSILTAWDAGVGLGVLGGGNGERFGHDILFHARQRPFRGK